MQPTNEEWRKWTNTAQTKWRAYGVGTTRAHLLDQLIPFYEHISFAKFKRVLSYPPPDFEKFIKSFATLLHHIDPSKLEATHLAEIKRKNDTQPDSTQPLPLSSVARDLTRLGVTRARVFEQAGLFAGNEHRLCIGNVLSLYRFRGSRGISPNLIAVKENDHELPFPDYLQRTIPTVSVTGKNRLKAFVTNLQLAPLDQDEGAVVHLAPGPFSIKLAMDKCRAELARDLAARTLRLSDDPAYGPDQPPLLPCALHCDGLVLTSDRKVLLAQRGPSVHGHPLLWGASFGEGTEWNEDRDLNGQLHPLRTLWRGLGEELGLHRQWIEEEYGTTTRIRFMDVGFDYSNFALVFFAISDIPRLTSERAQARWEAAYEKGRELRRVDVMEFSPEACAAAVVNGQVAGKQLVDGARFAIVVAALAEFGTEFETALAKM